MATRGDSQGGLTTGVVIPKKPKTVSTAFQEPPPPIAGAYGGESSRRLAELGVGRLKRCQQEPPFSQTLVNNEISEISILSLFLFLLLLPAAYIILQRQVASVARRLNGCEIQT